MGNIKNSVTLIGRLGNDVELKELDDGKKMATFSLETNETFSGTDGEKVTKAQWHSIVAFDEIAEAIEKSLFKRDEVVLKGKILYHELNKDGFTKYCTEIHVSEFHKTAVKMVSQSID
jgi:single-strand DNA-binding protein